jgi:hypothetical protein
MCMPRELEIVLAASAPLPMNALAPIGVAGGS